MVEDCWNTASGVAEHNRLGLRGHRFWGRCTVIIVDRWGIVSPGVTHRGFSGVSPPESRNNYRGIAGETSFRIGPHNTFGISLGERLLESPHHHQRSFGAAGTSLWGRWTSSSRLGLLEHRFWGRWTFSSRLGLRRNITSGVAEHHRRLRVGENNFWGRCTIIISISRRTPASSGVAPAFRQHLFCSSSTRLLCLGERQKRGRLLRSYLYFLVNNLIVIILLILEMQL